MTTEKGLKPFVVIIHLVTLVKRSCLSTNHFFSAGSMEWIIGQGPLQVVIGIVYGIVLGVVTWYLPSPEEVNSLRGSGHFTKWIWGCTAVHLHLLNTVLQTYGITLMPCEVAVNNYPAGRPTVRCSVNANVLLCKNSFEKKKNHSVPIISCDILCNFLQ